MQATPDAESHWIDRLPPRLRPYLRLSRLDRPAGAWLLYLPCLWGLLLGALLAPDAAHQARPLALWLALGALAMRGAGCTWNDILDRDLDARVARTRSRPIPSGQVGVARAFAWTLAQCLVGLGVLLQLNRAAALWALGSTLLVALYPLMKRITWFPQAWLGLTFNWGALVGVAAITGAVNAPALFLYAAGFFWTLGYDTIYALQDREDDALAGVKSSARALGRHVRPGVAVFYVLAALLAATAAGLAGGWPAACLTGPFAGHLLWQAIVLLPDDGAQALRLFRANRDAGLLLAAGLLVAGLAGLRA